MRASKTVLLSQPSWYETGKCVTAKASLGFEWMVRVLLVVAWLPLVQFRGNFRINYSGDT